ncbi:glucans biosynthesis glucosyltransferase MdoH [soil metagenome]
MNRLALRSEDFLAGAVEYGTDLGADAWLPEDAPLDMPRQAFDAISPAAAIATDTSPATVGRRRLVLAAATVLVTALAAVTPFILYARHGFDALEVLAFSLFLVLISSIACWFSNSAIGLWVLLTNREQDDLAFSPHPSAPTTRTALLMPLYNEDAQVALGRLSAIDLSLARLGVTDAFDLFVLSDTNKTEPLLAEQAAFAGFRLRANAQAFYRHRDDNVEAKSGNITDWTRRFGGAYDFMIVLDADSTMAGETVLRMVDAMERNPGIGLIQTAPTIVKAQTLFARVSQFSVKLYGRVAAAGLAWWTGSEGSYWGHNAILRTRAFAEACGLPILPGKKPFGGHIMSHDVVEAALLRRAGWAVHVTAALDGSCEETPPTITDFVRREHRWCQGNLQHIALLFSPGLTVASRVQLFMGVLAYVASPLWFASLVTGLIIQLQYPIDWASFFYFLHPQFTPFMLASLLAGVLLIGPKIMGAVLVLSRPRERRAFGGGRQIVKGMMAEIFLSATLAPIFMVANTVAVTKILCGQDAGWHAQQRDADGVSWADAFRAMRWQMIVGAAFVATLAFRPDLASFFIPIVAPLVLAAPIVVWTSRRASGEAFARKGYLVTPAGDEQSATPSVLHGPSRPSAMTDGTRIRALRALQQA